MAARAITRNTSNLSGFRYLKRIFINISMVEMKADQTANIVQVRKKRQNSRERSERREIERVRE
jgi:hypothetical protein